MNRWLAILILSFGTTFLVVNAAIPHHHHDGVVCYHHDEGNSQARQASHQHSPSNPLDFNCSLKQFYIAPSGKREMMPNSFNITWSQPNCSGIAFSQDLNLAREAFPLKLLSYYTLQDFPDPAIILSGPRAPPLS